ncbi:FimV/HubP family polar landmark protein [Dechloromonas sp. ZY10]|uniref:FimV/HubP family polar landmark protein n=1 Tax=Dechloromonas aquae TaxID=2664436 RepID=UPI003528A6DD
MAVASCLSLLHVGVEAAGLGKLTVLSSLGQPLRAELDLGATRDELSGMTARLASQDAFRQAGIEYAPALSDLRFVVDKRPNGAAVIKVSSNKAINEPFLDFLVELNWPAGRLVREYTFLLDPPEVKSRQSAPAVAEAKVVEGVRDSVRTPDPVSRKPEPLAAPEPSKPLPPAKPEKAEKTEPRPGIETPTATRIVQAGDTLRKIASETKPEEVTLEQMLVALYRKNPDAFLGNNIHRMKSGAILSIPDREAAAAVTAAEARKVYVSHTGDWQAYRQKLAAAAPVSAARDDAGQASAGKITAKGDEKLAPAEAGKDQLRVSRTELVGKGGAKSAASEADVIAREKALKEAQERLAMLEKNVGEMQKLLEMKNQRLADLQQQLSQQKEARPVEAPKPVEPVKPAEPAKPVAAEKPVEVAKVPVPAEAAKPVEAPKPEEAVKPEEATPPAAAPAEAPKPVEAPKPPRMPPPPPEPEPEPDFVAMLLEDPSLLAGGGGIAALLLGYALYRRRRSQATGDAGSTTMGSSAATAYPVTGGQSIDTANTPPQTGDFSQTGPGTIDTDEVDPVAEADVYMAYGRDAQAEEILLEALLKDPHRIAIHVKLLEIYAQRRSLKQFETLAGEVYAQTGGQGPEWAKVAALGAGIDPGNPLYSGAQATAAAATATATAFSPEATMIVQPEDNPQLTAAPVPVESVIEPELPSVETSSLDFDLGELPAEMPRVTEAPQTDGNLLDFDLGAPQPELTQQVEPEAVVVDEGNLLDFDLGEAVAVPAIGEVPTEQAGNELDFDLDLPLASEPEVTEAPILPALDETVRTTAAPLEMSIPDINLDLADLPPATEAPLGEFDLQLDLPAEPEPALTAAPILPETAPDDVVLEFDLGDLPATSSEAATPAPAEDNALAVDLDLDFDLDLPAADASPAEVPAAAPLPEFDLGDLDLDLAVTAPAEAEVAPASGEIVRDAHWEEVNTKLDLAKAYEEMGDLEGARELLNEVVGEGTPDLVAQAQEVLSRIAG